MTFLELLRQDCKDFETVRQSHLKGGNIEHLAGTGSPLLCSAHQELMNVGVLVAVCGTLANLLQRNEADAVEARSLFECFMPQQGIMQGQFYMSLAANEPAAAFALGKVDNRVMFARRVTETWMRPISGKLSPFVEIAVLADVWQRSCASVLEAEQLLNTMSPGVPLRADGGLANKTLSTLAEAADGGAACVDQYGRLSVPGWAERRASERRLCNIDATVSHGARSMSCKVANISRTGYRISRLAGAIPAGDLTLTIHDRALRGSIVWQRDNCLGAKWQTPLDVGDNLLAGAEVTPSSTHVYNDEISIPAAAAVEPQLLHRDSAPRQRPARQGFPHLPDGFLRQRARTCKN